MRSLISMLVGFELCYDCGISLLSRDVSMFMVKFLLSDLSRYVDMVRF